MQYSLKNTNPYTFYKQLHLCEITRISFKICTYILFIGTYISESSMLIAEQPNVFLSKYS